MTVSFKVKKNIDEKIVTQRLEKIVDTAQAKLDIQVLKDSNFYIPFDSGMLRTSGILNTVAGSGRVTWDTPYAKKQYYGYPNKSKDKNPNASGKWFDMAKANKLKDWEKLVNEECNKNH